MEQTEIDATAKQLAFESWPKAFPYGRAKWVQENWVSFISKAKEKLKNDWAAAQNRPAR